MEKSEFFPIFGDFFIRKNRQKSSKSPKAIWENWPRNECRAKRAHSKSKIEMIPQKFKGPSLDFLDQLFVRILFIF